MNMLSLSMTESLHQSENIEALFKVQPLLSLSTKIMSSATTYAPYSDRLQPQVNRQASSLGTSSFISSLKQHLMLTGGQLLLQETRAMICDQVSMICRYSEHDVCTHTPRNMRLYTWPGSQELSDVLCHQKLHFWVQRTAVWKPWNKNTSNPLKQPIYNLIPAFILETAFISEPTPRVRRDYAQQRQHMHMKDLDASFVLRTLQWCINFM